MYIELFLLDNLLMNILILRLAAAARSVRIHFFRMLLASALGAFYAALAVSTAPFLLSWPMKLASGLLMAFALPVWNWRSYCQGVIAVLIAAAAIGGIAAALSFSMGGGLQNGYVVAPVPLRIALLAAAAAAGTPALIRRLMGRRLSGTVRVRIREGNTSREYRGCIDSGNMLSDPVSGRPVIIVFDPGFNRSADIPIPCSTVGWDGIVKAFRPDSVEIYNDRWISADALVALTEKPLDSAQALVPPAAVAK